MLGDLEVKVLSVGLGWAAADLATSNLLDIIFQQGWSNELKPEYLTQALGANLDFIEILLLASFAQMLTQKGNGNKVMIYVMIVGRYLMPVVARYYKEKEGNGCDMCMLGVRAVFTGLMYGASRMIKQKQEQ